LLREFVAMASEAARDSLSDVDALGGGTEALDVSGAALEESAATTTRRLGDIGLLGAEELVVGGLEEGVEERVHASKHARERGGEVRLGLVVLLFIGESDSRFHFEGDDRGTLSVILFVTCGVAAKAGEAEEVVEHAGDGGVLLLEVVVEETRSDKHTRLLGLRLRVREEAQVREDGERGGEGGLGREGRRLGHLNRLLIAVVV